MKKLLVILGIAGLGMMNVSGFDTNLMTFKTKSGIVSNALPVRIESGKLVYRTENGGGTVKMTELPRELWGRFDYDETSAQADQEKEKAQRIRQIAIAQARAEADAETRRLKEVEAHAVVIFGKIIQRLDDKLLVNGDSQLSGEWTQEGANNYFHQVSGKLLKIKLPKQWSLARGTLLLTDYPNVKKLVDGDVIQTVAYPAGTYSYTAVSGGTKTVRKYTADIRYALIEGQ